MAIQKTEAIILKTQPFRSSSLIVTFFSKSFGKLRGLAKGVRLERELRGALYELFTQVEIVYYEKTRSDLHLISEASILNTYDPMRRKLDSICYASYFAELADQLSEVHDPHEPVYDLLDSSFRYLPSLPGERVSRIFEIKLLNEVGWLPYLDRCLQCGEKRIPDAFLSARQGALVCGRCAHEIPDARPISAEALESMRYFIRHSFDDCLRSNLSQSVLEQFGAFIERFLLDRLGYPLKSRQFMGKVLSKLK